MFEVDFRTKISQLKDTIDPLLLHFTGTHIVLQDDRIIGEIHDLIALARDSYGLEDAEVVNTVLYNRDVRESTFRLMTESGNPVMVLQFGIERAHGFEDMGTVHVEL